MPSRRSLLGRVLLGGSLLAARPALAAGNSYYAGPPSDHFDGTRFFNPGAEPDGGGLLRVLQWRLTSVREPWPGNPPSGPPDRPPPRVAGARCRIAFVGHASFLLQTAGLNILLDPVWSERASPVDFAGPERYTRPGIAFDDLPAIDAVLVSHNHYDHLDLETLGRLWQRDRPRFVTPLGNDTIIRSIDASIPVETGDWGDAVRLSRDAVVHLRRAHHWSARGIADRRHALWAAFVVDVPGGGVYFVGDTGFGDGSTFRETARAHPRLRVAILPIGAYAPRSMMREHHMNPAEAVAAFRLSGARRAVAHHWGTFRLTDEGYGDPPADLSRALAAAGLPPRAFVAPIPGTVLEV